MTDALFLELKRASQNITVLTATQPKPLCSLQPKVIKSDTFIVVDYIPPLRIPK